MLLGGDGTGVAGAAIGVSDEYQPGVGLGWGADVKRISPKLRSIVSLECA